jgi:hypothetical protein
MNKTKWGSIPHAADRNGRRILLQISVLNTFTLFKKYNKIQNRKGKDFTLDSVKKRTEPAYTGCKNDNAGDENLASASKAPTPLPRHSLPVTDDAEILQGGLNGRINDESLA